MLLPPQINSKMNDGLKETRFRVDIKKAATVSNESEVPVEFSLNQNYPNPFNPSTNITFNLPISGDVQLKVYNLAGQLVATLFEGFKSGGQHSVNWNAEGFASGIYVYQLVSNGQVLTKKMTLIK